MNPRDPNDRRCYAAILAGVVAHAPNPPSIEHPPLVDGKSIDSVVWSSYTSEQKKYIRWRQWAKDCAIKANLLFSEGLEK